MKKKPYRQNAGIIVFNSSGQVLVGQRQDRPQYLQFPQGGIDKKESPLKAAYRELNEETGLVLYDPPIFEFPSWLSYDFPAGMHGKLAQYRGQTQKWFFFFWDGSLAELDYRKHEKAEFSTLTWTDFKRVCQKVLPFKKAVYQSLYAKGPEIIQNYLALRRACFWGDPGYKEPLSLPFREYLKESLSLKEEELEVNPFPLRLPKQIPASRLGQTRMKELSKILGQAKVSTKDQDRLSHASAKFFTEILDLRQGRLPALPDAVVYPQNEKEITQVVQWCQSRKTALLASGGRSSVTRALSMPKGGLAMDLSARCFKVLAFKPLDAKITVQPGISGPALEKFLNARGFTCGHFPQSFEYSTVGGWVAANGAGQASTGYGRISDMVLGLKIVTGRGLLVIKDYPAAALGPELRRLFIGSEGCLGVLSEITLRIQPFDRQKSKAKMTALLFKDFKKARNAMRSIMQGGFGHPHFFRLQDADETELGLRLGGRLGRLAGSLFAWLGYKPYQRCLMHIAMYGDPSLQALVLRKSKAIASKNGAICIGPSPVRHWFKQRYTSAYLRDTLFEHGLAIDSLETVTSWQNLPRLWQGVRKKIRQRPRTICLSHISHAYENGANLYFIFITKLKKEQTKADFLKFHSGIIDAIQKEGGALSHHHGIGRLLAPWLKKVELGSLGMGLLQALKNHNDPGQIFNPGSLANSSDNIWGLN